MPTEQQNGQIHQDYRRIAIVGSWSVTVDMVPWDDESLEIWGLAWRADLKRSDRVFDPHDMSFLEDKTKYQRRVPKNYLEHLKKFDCPVYLQEKHTEVPKSQAYPLKEIQGFFMHVDPNHTKPYFASTIAYMVAMAIAEGVNEIHLYGVDLSEDTEWGYQKPNTEYYLGMARGRGIKVIVPKESSLMTFSHTYGYDPHPEYDDILVQEMKKRHAHYVQNCKRLEIEKATYDGARQECEEALKAMRQAKKRKEASEHPQVPDLVLEELEKKEAPKVKTTKSKKVSVVKELPQALTKVQGNQNG